MSVPEFRGWDEEHQVMVYFDLFGTDGGFLYDNEHGGIPVMFTHSSSVMQYIWLSDRNGKKLFEDDVVRCEGFGGTYKVVRDGCCFVGQHIEGNNTIDLEMQILEGIGNPYENPELLEGK